jgi:DNA-binding transcriptional MocR family regulator
MTCSTRPRIPLSSGNDAGEVIERGAALSVLAAPGEVFYVSPGHSGVIRLSVGSVETAQVSVCARLLMKSIQQSGASRSTAIYVWRSEAQGS